MLGGGPYEATTCPECGSTMWNGRCENPDAVIGRMREEGIELTMNNIIRQVFEEGRYILTKAREEKIASLPAEPLTEADFELRGNLERLNPEQDFSFWINLQDTNFRGKSELQELYESMFTEELEQCENLTGYPIEW